MPSNTAEASKDILLPSKTKRKMISGTALQETTTSGSDDTTLETRHGPGPMVPHSSTASGSQVSPTMSEKAAKIVSACMPAAADGMTSHAHAISSSLSVSISPNRQVRATLSRAIDSNRPTPTAFRQEL